MNTEAEEAIVQILLAVSAITDLVGDRVTWDEEELDLAFPALTLRTLATAIPGQLSQNPALRNPLLEISAHATTSTGASQLLDLVVTAMESYRNRSTISLSGGGTVVFPSMRLNDVQQSPAIRERSYRKSARYSVWLAE